MGAQTCLTFFEARHLVLFLCMRARAVKTSTPALKGKYSRKGGERSEENKVELAGNRPCGEGNGGTMISTRQKFY
jgi:hypothetical protein